MLPGVRRAATPFRHSRDCDRRVLGPEAGLLTGTRCGQMVLSTPGLSRLHMAAASVGIRQESQQGFDHVRHTFSKMGSISTCSATFNEAVMLGLKPMG